MKTLNVIGAGRVGLTLAFLWHEKGAFAVQDVLDGTPEGASEAVRFTGSGKPVASIDAMRPADVWMITTPDKEIVASNDKLAAACVVRSGDVVFHCTVRCRRASSPPSSRLAHGPRACIR